MRKCCVWYKGIGLNKLVVVIKMYYVDLVFYLFINKLFVIKIGRKGMFRFWII